MLVEDHTDTVGGFKLRRLRLGDLPARPRIPLGNEFMGTGINEACAVSVGRDQVYLIGGETGGDPGEIVSDVFTYSLSGGGCYTTDETHDDTGDIAVHGNWARKEALPRPLCGAMCGAANGVIVLVGGQSSYPSPSRYFVPGLPHVLRIELRQALISYQYYRNVMTL